MSSSKNSSTSAAAFDSSQANKGSINSSNPPTERPAQPSVKSYYRIIKDGWGSRSNFQHSHGLPLTPEGFDEGRAILDAYLQIDRENSGYLENVRHSEDSDDGEEEYPVCDDHYYPARYEHHESYEHREDDQDRGDSEDSENGKSQGSREDHGSYEDYQDHGYCEDCEDHDGFQDNEDYYDCDDYHGDCEDY